MNKISFFVSLLFLVSCASIVELRDQKLTSSVKPEEVRPGCYRQVGIKPAVFRAEPEVIVEKPTTLTEEIPAKRETIQEEILEKEAHTSCSYNGDIVYCKEVPAKYRTVDVEIEYPAYTKVTTVPGRIIRKPVLLEGEKPDIREVICPEKATPVVIKRIQLTLKRAGLDPGGDDGRLYKKTMDAIHDYEKRKGLDVSGDDFIYMKTIKAMGAL